MLDCVWAGLPAVVTRGDSIGDDLAARGLALDVPSGDAPAVAAALAQLLEDREARASRTRRFTELGEALKWDRLIGPLAEFIERPRLTRPERLDDLPIEHAEPLVSRLRAGVRRLAG